MLPQSRIEISPHALRRFRQRVKHGATPAEIEHRIRAARACGRATRKRIRGGTVDGALYLKDGACVYILKVMPGVGRYVLVTVLSHDMLAAKKKKHRRRAA